MATEPKEFEIKFDGATVRALHGAPADTVIASLQAIQRMVYIAAMEAEGRRLTERLKPTGRVRRNFAVVCKATREGSHVQPFEVRTQQGHFTPENALVADKVLATLRAFNTGSDQTLIDVLPNPRERWFMAKAASGLLPPPESGVEIGIRAGRHGKFDFKAAKARSLIAEYGSQRPPDVGEETVVGKLSAVDFNNTAFSVRPASAPTLRLGYPLQLEPWLQSNARKRLMITGRPHYNERGDISTFDEIYTVSEVESHLPPIEAFRSGDRIVRAKLPIRFKVDVDWPHRLFVIREPALGVHVETPDYDSVLVELAQELDVVWRNYALADESSLDEEARKLKHELRSRFVEE